MIALIENNIINCKNILARIVKYTFDDHFPFDDVMAFEEMIVHRYAHFK